MAEHTLVVLRHAKSDWDVAVSDRERPLNKRGRRQAPEAGQWLADFCTEGALELDLAVVSPAHRTRETWELVGGELATPPPLRIEEAAYTFDGDDLLEVVRDLGDERAVVLVSHNPAVEELVAALTGDRVVMPTSSLADIEMESGWDGAGRLVAHGRPPD